MHTNEQFLMKMTAEQIEQLKEQAATLSAAHMKALNEQLARLGL